MPCYVIRLFFFIIYLGALVTNIIIILYNIKHLKEWNQENICQKYNILDDIFIQFKIGTTYSHDTHEN